MAEKRYYWLKMKENYLSEPKIKKLRKVAGGDTFTIIYLKMQLLSIRNEGFIEYEGIEPTFEEELALKLDEELDNVTITVNYLKSMALMEENIDDNKYFLIEASNNIGSEGQSAERKRRFDDKKKKQALLGNGVVTDEKQNSISISNYNSLSNSNSFSSNKESNNISDYRNRLNLDDYDLPDFLR